MCKPSLIRFAFVRFIFVSDVFRDIYPRFPSRRNIGNDRQLIDLMSLSLHYGSHRAAPIACVCGWAEVSLSSCVSSPFRKAIPNSKASYYPLALSRSWRMASLAAEILYRQQD